VRTMTDRVGQRRTSGFAVFTLVMVVLFVGAGVWHLQRLVGQHALIAAALDERLAAAPVPLPDPSQWHTLTSEKDEFRRVSFTATYESRLDAMVYSSDTSMRSDISGPGNWAFIPAQLPTGETVGVNAGFVPNTIQDRNQQDRVVAQLITNKPVRLTGYLRFPVAAGLFTPNVEHAKRLWFTRDHLAMAQALGWDRVAPFYLDLEAPVPPSGIPKPGPLQVHLPDNHMRYAITQSSLAGLLLIAFAVWLRGRMLAPS
jgi:cytochrome oxidase assembly protein ShyY1